ncbi:MAG: ABC transporter ATP-binding protein [Chloroflexi bacterium]|nr:ABC transporter ATP-binding protein [Chloroflexota bacterium]
MANMWAFGSTEEVRIADPRGTFVRLWGYMAEHRVTLLAVAIAILAVSLLSMLPPWLAKHVIDEVIPAEVEVPGSSRSAWP